MTVHFIGTQPEYDILSFVYSWIALEQKEILQ
jgi:hypothetical protein